MTELDGPTFFALAYRLDSYEGAVRAAAMREAEEEQQMSSMGYNPDYPEEPPEYVDAQPEPIRELDSTPYDDEVPALTAEQLAVMFPAAPQIGQEVPMFEVTKVT